MAGFLVQCIPCPASIHTDPQAGQSTFWQEDYKNRTLPVTKSTNECGVMWAYFSAKPIRASLTRSRQAVTYDLGQCEARKSRFSASMTANKLASRPLRPESACPSQPADGDLDRKGFRSADPGFSQGLGGSCSGTKGRKNGHGRGVQSVLQGGLSIGQTSLGVKLGNEASIAKIKRCGEGGRGLRPRSDMMEEVMLKRISIFSSPFFPLPVLIPTLPCT